MQEASEAVPSGMLSVLGQRQSNFSFACLEAQEHCESLGIENPVCQVSNYLFPDCRVISGHLEVSAGGSCPHRLQSIVPQGFTPCGRRGALLSIICRTCLRAEGMCGRMRAAEGRGSQEIAWRPADRTFVTQPPGSWVRSEGQVTPCLGLAMLCEPQVWLLSWRRAVFCGFACFFAWLLRCLILHSSACCSSSGVTYQDILYTSTRVGIHRPISIHVMNSCQQWDRAAPVQEHSIRQGKQSGQKPCTGQLPCLTPTLPVHI